MSAIWLQKTDIANLVGAGVAVDTEISISELPRLAAAVLPGSGPIHAQIGFDKAENGVVLLQGRLRGAVQLTCQRCLNRMSVDIDDMLRLALLVSESEQLTDPKDYEQLIIPGGQLRLADLIEDEVLLQLPLSARHADEDCSPFVNSPNEPQGPAAETTTPFAGLAEMMRVRH